ncbi:MAG: hypothetical protein KBI41_08615 [Kiritimatiellae bacterium]|nr:hypothetical protein [Kiritimatiellia bacterium]MDD3583985.1 hypothetical protein [Kiritimatiellia bacterium]HON46196.1 hypothetical protein [Kiritimatiellia bacterium]
MKQGWIVCAVLLAASVVAQARGIKICFEAESATAVEAPMVVVSNGVEGASGAYLEIPEGAGNPPKVEAGKAVFTVDVPEDGAFTLWCRVWWEDECGNSFTVKIDDQPAFLFGEDATYKTWHWVKYPVARTTPPIKLAKGSHTLTFHNREDGVRLDQVLLSADKRFVPVEIETPGIRP